MMTVEANHDTAALERVAELNAEARARAEVLDYFAAVLRGGRIDPDGPPLEALPSAWRVPPPAGQSLRGGRAGRGRMGPGAAGGACGPAFTRRPAGGRMTGSPSSLGRGRRCRRGAPPA
jgi:hypothetical protein